MISANMVRTVDGIQVKLTETKDSQVLWSRMITVNDAAFLSMEIDEILRERRILAPIYRKVD
jgi:hypothetical protein